MQLTSLFKTSAMLIMTLAMFTNCEKEEITQQPSLSLEGMELDLALDINFGEAVFETGNVEVIAEEIEDIIFLDDAEETFDAILITHPKAGKTKIKLHQKMRSNEETPDFMLPCPKQSKSCFSRDCVAGTVQNILGDGDRDVVIEYDRQATRVKITWQYMDC